MILILGGTSDTHEIIKDLKNNDFIISVATEYGFSMFKRLYGAKRVLKTHFNSESLEKFLLQYGIDTVIDTTHPFAKNITAAAKTVCERLNIRYIDKKRAILPENAVSYDKAVFFDEIEDVIDFLRINCRNILFTIGSNHLDKFLEFKDSGFFRILPFTESIEKCIALGIDSRRIIAIQGPFSANFNRSMIEEYGIDCMVTKNSSYKGGLIEKIESAKLSGIYIAIMNNI